MANRDVYKYEINMKSLMQRGGVRDSACAKFQNIFFC